MDTGSSLRRSRKGAETRAPEPPAQDLPDLRIVPQSQLLREQVLDKLRDAIMQGWYSPGARLKERELCERVGVSRTSVREALRKLETEGLVNVEHRRGPVVSSITLRQAEEIYEVRGVIEVFAVKRFIAHADAKERAELRRFYREFVHGAKGGDMAVLVASMSGFYDTLFRGVGNSLLHTMSRQLMARISYLRATSMSEMGRPKFSMREIGAIVDAIEAGDAAAAERAVLDHLAHASEAAFRQLDKPPSPAPQGAKAAKAPAPTNRANKPRA